MTRAAEGSKSGRKKEHTAPEMCFGLGGDCSVQTIHGANDGKYTKPTKPGVEPGFGTKASAAAPATADSQLLNLTKPMVPPPEKRVREKAMMNPLQGRHPCQLLVMKVVKPAKQPAADVRSSPLPVTIREKAYRQASSGECDVAGSVWRRQNQQRACCFRNLCDTSCQI